MWHIKRLCGFKDLYSLLLKILVINVLIFSIAISKKNDRIYEMNALRVNTMFELPIHACILKKIKEVCRYD